jgi:hypothetical protein
MKKKNRISFENKTLADLMTEVSGVWVDRGWVEEKHIDLLKKAKIITIHDFLTTDDQIMCQLIGTSKVTFLEKKIIVWIRQNLKLE